MRLSKYLTDFKVFSFARQTIHMDKFTRDLCFLFLVMASTKAKSQSFQIDTFLQHQIKEYHIPAVSVAVIDNGKVIFTKTYGKANLEYHIPNTKSTAFQLASVTKLISATAIMTLVQDGKLDLNQKARHYLPQLPQSWDDMKVIDLLSHQSGIADLLALKREFSSLEEALDTAIARPLDFQPGTQTVLFSSIEDLSKWIVALDKFTLLKPETQEQMWTASKLRDGKDSPFGVGWIVAEHNGEKATGHSGGPALADIVRLTKRKITVIVLTNQLELRPFLTMKVLDLYINHKK
jgi:hypothetical protein